MTAPEPANIAWILLAAGSSTRFGGTRSKLLEPLGEGRVIDHTISNIRRSLPGARIILVSSDDLRIEIGHGLEWTPGGRRRQDSARLGLGAAGDAAVALIQDAARPFVTKKIVQDLITALEEADAAAPAVPVTDTIRVVGSGAIETLDRATLRAMQTPQAVRVPIARDAFKATEGGREFTDDLAVIAAHGGRIALTEGDRRNMKVTTREDLAVAQTLIT